MEIGDIYKCEVCGNIVEINRVGGGTLVCCEQDMVLQEAQTQDPEKGEKHVPMIVGRLVVVGMKPHPMKEEHYIEWIEATNGKETSKIFLNPGDEPKAEFSFSVTSAKAYCNLHGNWVSSDSQSNDATEFEP